MIRRRVVAVEKRLASLGGLAGKPRLVFCFGNEMELLAKKAESQDEKDRLIIFNMPRPGQRETDGVFRFDFGCAESQSRQVKEKADDARENSFATDK